MWYITDFVMTFVSITVFDTLASGIIFWTLVDKINQGGGWRFFGGQGLISLLLISGVFHISFELYSPHRIGKARYIFRTFLYDFRPSQCWLQVPRVITLIQLSAVIMNFVSLLKNFEKTSHLAVLDSFGKFAPIISVGHIETTSIDQSPYSSCLNDFTITLSCILIARFIIDLRDMASYTLRDITPDTRPSFVFERPASGPEGNTQTVAVQPSKIVASVRQQWSSLMTEFEENETLQTVSIYRENVADGDS